MCIHILSHLYLRCGHLRPIPPSFPTYIPPLKCPEVRRQLYHYHRQPLFLPLQYPLPPPRPCTPIWGTLSETGNVYVRPVDWFCPPCSQTGFVSLIVNPEEIVAQGWEVREGDGWREVNKILEPERGPGGDWVRELRREEERAKRHAREEAVRRGWEMLVSDTRQKTWTGFPSLALPPHQSDFVEAESQNVAEDGRE